MDEVVALLVDVVSSRTAARRDLHAALRAGADEVNRDVEALSPLRTTVGDEMQGVYPTLGDALRASIWLRLELAPTWDVRCGIGGGEVTEVGDGIQDGSAWWRAREAIDWVKALAAKPGHASARTAIRDGRANAMPVADAMARLVDAHVARLRPGALASLHGLLRGHDNAAVAAAQGITASANSQRIANNGLRPLADAIAALGRLP